MLLRPNNTGLCLSGRPTKILKADVAKYNQDFSTCLDDPSETNEVNIPTTHVSGEPPLYRLFF
jgi:hypothetical protein